MTKNDFICRVNGLESEKDFELFKLELLESIDTSLRVIAAWYEILIKEREEMKDETI